MSRKPNPEKGLRTVSIEFGGKTRTLKFGHAAIGDFEAEANQILRQQKAVEPGNMVFADGIMQTWLGNAKIFSMALRYAMLNDLPENIDAAIDSYIEAGNSKLELTRAVIRAYRMATDPSSLASLERNWKISDDRQKVLTEADNERLTTIEKAIADVQAKQTPGIPSTDSPS
jgi:hypothetical protein